MFARLLKAAAPIAAALFLWARPAGFGRPREGDRGRATAGGRPREGDRGRATAGGRPREGDRGRATAGGRPRVAPTPCAPPQPVPDGVGATRGRPFGYSDCS